MAANVEDRRRPRYFPGHIAQGAQGLFDVARELERIAEYLSNPAVDALQFTIQTELPERPREGLIMFFAAGVAGGTAGLYEYRGGAWTVM